MLVYMHFCNVFDAVTCLTCTVVRSSKFASRRHIYILYIYFLRLPKCYIMCLQNNSISNVAECRLGGKYISRLSLTVCRFSMASLSFSLIAISRSIKSIVLISTDLKVKCKELFSGVFGDVSLYVCSLYF